MTSLPAAGTGDLSLPRAYGAPACARFGPATLRAAWWAARACREVRSRLAIEGMRTAVTPPPRLPEGATRGVLGVLRRKDPTCLERSLVLQAWLSACGEPYDVIVGVDIADDVEAHAWLPFEAGRRTSRFTEMTRIPARREPRAAGDPDGAGA